MNKLVLLLEKLRPDIEDIHAYGGIALMSVGAGLWHVEVGLVVAGFCLFGLAVFPHLRGRVRR